MKSVEDIAWSMSSSFKKRKVKRRRKPGPKSKTKKTNFKIKKKAVVNKGGLLGRPWHSDSTGKVCLLCLRRYDESVVMKLQEELDYVRVTEDEEEDEDDDCVIISSNCDPTPPSLEQDPLGDSPVKESPLQNKSPVVRKERSASEKVLKPSLYMRFLRILSRYLGVKTKRFRDSAIRNKLSCAFCEECFKTVQRMCECYQELQSARLNLLWKFSQIAQTIRDSKSKVSEKLRIALLKNLSTQLRVMSNAHVDIFRKQIALKCAAKLSTLPPKVHLKRAHIPASLAPIPPPTALSISKMKLLYPLEVMKQYMKSLIVIFTLAVPFKDPEPQPQAEKIMSSENSKRIKHVKIKKENVPPSELDLAKKIKKEHHEGIEGEDGNHDYGDHFDEGGGNYSPGGGSGPASPVGNDNEEDDIDREEGNKSDSDWSMDAGGGAASGHDSDVEFTIKPSSIENRRWNLRKRRTRSSLSNAADGDNEEDHQMELPPLRRRIFGKAKIPESELHFSCNLCSRKFHLEGSLKRHLSYAHAIFVPYSCNKCNLRFKSSNDYDRHWKKVHQPPRAPKARKGYSTSKPAACTVCKKMFPSTIKMMVHRKTTHQLSRKVECEICKKIIRGPHRLEMHMQRHKEIEDALKCSKCWMSFGEQEKLEDHEKYHEENPEWVPTRPRGRPIGRKITTPKEEEEEGSYKCTFPDCGKSFRWEANYTIHVSLHDFNFNCTVCEAKFTFDEVKFCRKHLRDKHEKAEEKNYFCLHCDKGFTLLQTYDLHRRVTHPTKLKLKCDVYGCFDKFNDEKELKDHLKQKHLPSEYIELLVELNLTIPPRKPGEGKKPGPVNREDKTEKDGNDAGVLKPNESTMPPPSDFQKSQKEQPQSEVTTEKSEVKIPIENQNPPKPVPKADLYICARCNWPFSQKGFLDTHMLVHTPMGEDKLFHCDPCKQKFRTAELFQLHYNRYHGENLAMFECDKCGWTFNRKMGYLKHLQKHESGWLPDLDENEKHKRHRASQPTLATFPDDPGSDSEGKEKKKRLGPRIGPLLNEERELKETNGKCPYCDEEFTDGRLLYLHKLKEHRERWKKCRVCDEKFQMSEKLFKHMYTEHGIEPPYRCDHPGCEKFMYSRYLLRNHQVSHRERTIPCHLCPKMFKRQVHLTEHIKVHYQIKEHICEHCGMAFVKPTSLRYHLDIHLGIKNHVCKFCGKKFCRKFAKDCHERTHTQEKSFICSYCGLGFVQHSSMRAHVKSLHENDGTEPKRRRRRTNITRKKSTSEEEEDEEEQGQDENESEVKVKQSGGPSASTSDSGIIHEALQAAFSDILSDSMKEEVKGEERVNETNTVASSEAYAAVEALLNSETGTTERETRSRSGRAPPKNYKAMADGKKSQNNNGGGRGSENQGASSSKPKELICGFCGKQFKREKLFQQHVDKHLSIDSILENKVSPAAHQDHQNEQQPTFHLTIPSTIASTSTPPPEPEPQTKRRGRPKKGSSGSTNTPGSRLAKIVEDVTEAATSKSSISSSSDLIVTPVSSPVVSSAGLMQFQQQNLPQQAFHHHQQTPSPHSMGGSEHSTPAGSPAPMQFHQNPVTTATATSTQGQSYVSPFLLPSNPYVGQQQVPQTQSFPNFQIPYSQGQTSQEQAPAYTQMYHQQLLQQQQRLSQRQPQDLSKSGFSMFFANPRS